MEEDHKAPNTNEQKIRSHEHEVDIVTPDVET